MAHRIAFISDLHANIRLPFARVDEGGISSDRLRDVVGVLRQAGEKCREMKVGALYILGDLFDQKHPDGATLVSTSKALRELADGGISVNILPGNHDAVDRDGRLYTLQFLDVLKVPGIRVLGHEAIEPVAGVQLHAMPWLPDKRALKRMRSIDTGTGDDRNILLFHQSVVGAIGDTGWVSDEGLPDGAHDGFEYSLSGHYHKPQEHSWGRYLGSPLQMRFSDEGVTDRGMWVVDVEAKRLKPKLVPLDAPLFGTVQIRLDKAEDIDALDIEKAAQHLDYLRIIVEGDPTAIASAQRQLLEWKGDVEKYDLRCIKIDQRPDRTTATHRIKLDTSLSPANIAKQYAEAKEQPADIIAVGTDIIKEVTR